MGFYHERKDHIRNVGLGPEHDWSSHAAGADGDLLREQPVGRGVLIDRSESRGRGVRNLTMFLFCSNLDIAGCIPFHTEPRPNFA
jgi:hypothetical protein